MKEITLKIDEISQRHVGKAIAIVDPKVVEENNLQSGDILEIIANRKSHVKLWPGSTEDYGTGIIRIDGSTRHNIGASIGEKASVKKVEASEADEIVISPTEKLSVEGLHEYMLTNYEGHVFTTGDTITVNTLGGKIQLIVTSSKPSKAVIVTTKTKFKLGSMTKAVENSIPRVTYDDLGGLKKEIQKVREMIELPMRHPELFEKIGVEAPKGVLLYGSPGTGKTLLAKAVAGETNAHFTTI
ncbi:MAG: AAA family ATPase, partial [Thermoproteota archaeon]